MVLMSVNPRDQQRSQKTVSSYNPNWTTEMSFELQEINSKNSQRGCSWGPPELGGFRLIDESLPTSILFLTAFTIGFSRLGSTVDHGFTKLTISRGTAVCVFTIQETINLEYRTKICLVLQREWECGGGGERSAHFCWLIDCTRLPLPSRRRKITFLRI